LIQQQERVYLAQGEFSREGASHFKAFTFKGSNSLHNALGEPMGSNWVGNVNPGQNQRILWGDCRHFLLLG
jgi:hypothetical protein